MLTIIVHNYEYVYLFCRDKMDAGLSFQLQAAGHRSQDSSDMDTDLQDWETEILNIDFVSIRNYYLVKYTHVSS